MSPTEPNGNGGVGLSPNVAVWAKAITMVGIPGVIALFLVWMGAQTLPNIQQEVTLNRNATQANHELLRDLLAQEQETYRLMLRICANTARDATERSQCFARE